MVPPVPVETKVVLEIRLLGTPEFAHAGMPFRFAAPPKTLPLLAWLLVHRRAPLARDGIAFAFWPDALEEDARGDLRRHLYYLTKALPGTDGEPWIVADKKTVAWNLKAPLRYDVAEFERFCADESRLEDAVALYRGPFLEGLDEQWIEPERERLQKLAETALLRLIARDAERDPERAIAFAQALRRVDPWREDAVRALIELRHRTGDRAGALHEYRDFAAKLRAELDVAPMPETTAVYDAIARADAPLPARPAVVPAPEHASAPHTNLPERSDSLVGRARALDDVRTLLETTRVATLAGTGGVGKTRLAIDAGWEALGATPDGVWFADLGPLSDGTLVASTIAAALGIAQATERIELPHLVNAVRRKKLLLVIDNCEHVVADVARAVEALIAGAPDVRVLATSREPLAVRGERVYRVPSLDVPPAFERLTPARARTYGAVALFELRASAAQPTFALDAENVAVVSDICRRLDGIALAIELAAARVSVLAPHDLARRLEERFRILTGGERTALPRQRTMRALVDWSWELCSDAERTALRRLAIFAGGWRLEAAESVCFDAPLDVENAIDLLSSLAEKSLLVAEPAGNPVRYRLLESIRAYGLEKLDAAGERDALAHRHAAYFAAFGKRVDDAYETTPDDRWYASATAELDNVRAALTWGFEHDPATAAALASAYGTVWEYGGTRADRRWLDVAYERLDRAANPELTTRLLWQIAAISHASGKHADWVAIAVRDRGDRRTRAEALCWLAETELERGRLDAAAAAVSESAALQDALHRPKSSANLLRVRALVEARRGDLAAATALLERAIVSGNACGALAVVAGAQVALAEVAFASGDVDRAIGVATAALDALRALFGRTIAVADVAANRAAYRIARGDLGAACDDAREALEIARDLDFPAHAIGAVEALAVAASLGGDASRAAVLLGFVDAERGRRGVARGATERAGYDRMLAALRGALAADELEAARARGAHAGVERATRIALDETTAVAS
jgi:predicted ATPase/DNA-binding SARP family transcriptional activator